MLSRFRLAATVVASTAIVTLGVTGCTTSGGDKAAVKPTETTTSVVATTASPTTTPDATTTEPKKLSPAEAAAQAKMAAINLVASDFPSGWTSEPAVRTGDGAFSTCARSDVETNLVARATSDDFSLTQGTGEMQISSSAGVHTTPAAAMGLMNEFRDDGFVTCASDLFATTSDQYTVTGSLARNGSEPGLADEAVALSGDYVLTPNDGSTPSNLSAVVVAIRSGDTTVIMSAAGIDAPLDEMLLRDLLDALAYRLSA